jgi:hypothetical protein
MTQNRGMWLVMPPGSDLDNEKALALVKGRELVAVARLRPQATDPARQLCGKKSPGARFQGEMTREAPIWRVVVGRVARSTTRGARAGSRTGPPGHVSTH